MQLSNRVNTTVIGFPAQTQVVSCEEQSQNAQLWMAAVLDQMSECILVTNSETRILYVNRAFCALTGYRADEVVGRKTDIFKSGVQSEAFYREMWVQLEETGRWEGNLWNRKKDGTLFYESQRIQTVTNEEGEIDHFIATFTDSTASLESDRYNEYLRNYDSTTAIPNRQRLLRFLDQYLSKNVEPCFSLIGVNIRRFEAINSNFGHSIGDIVLTTVAERLIRLGDKKIFVAKIGGHKFAVMLESSTGAERTRTVFEELNNALAETIVAHDAKLHLSYSFGVTHYPEHSDSPDRLLQNLEMALHHADQHAYATGEEAFVEYNDRIARKSQNTYTLFQHIKLALRNEEFCLHYQPQIDIQTGKTTCIEALLRWPSDAGVIPPDMFLPVAEQFDLMPVIDTYVFERALKDICFMKEQGVHVPKVAINVSNRLIPIDTIIGLMAKHHISSNEVEIEITERMMASDDTHLQEYLTELKNLGVYTAIDDFGTGYSSLERLMDLPFDKIKIDKKFVDSITSDKRHFKVLNAILEIARILEKTVVAEGVESDEQRVLLGKLGCSTLQGHLYSKPLPIEKLVGYIRSER